MARRPAVWAAAVLLASTVSSAHAAGPSKYLLFTTQRSGSSWFCEVLSHQAGISCGIHPTKNSEMLIHYSYIKGVDVAWQKWKHHDQRPRAISERVSGRSAKRADDVIASERVARDRDAERGRQQKAQ